jgi:Ca-activated chloride channel family protein
MQKTLAFTWQDLWVTKNRQAQKMLEKGDFSAAKNTFERDDWRAAAAFRAGDYKQAATLYHSMHDAEGFYNQGNALAYLGKYEQAIQAYNKSLKIAPKDHDTLHNRKIVEDLLKKQDQKQQQNQPNNKKQDQEQQQNQSNNDQQNQQNQRHDQQNQNNEQQNQDQKNNEQQDSNTNQSHDQDRTQQKQDQQQDKKDEEQQQAQNQAKTKQKSPSDRENEHAKKQWLRLIPDDPGGLLREKFLRDYMRRERG